MLAALATADPSSQGFQFPRELKALLNLHFQNGLFCFSTTLEKTPLRRQSLGFIRKHSALGFIFFFFFWPPRRTPFPSTGLAGPAPLRGGWVGAGFREAAGEERTFPFSSLPSRPAAPLRAPLPERCALPDESPPSPVPAAGREAGSAGRGGERRGWRCSGRAGSAAAGAPAAASSRRRRRRRPVAGPGHRTVPRGRHASARPPCRCAPRGRPPSFPVYAAPRGGRRAGSVCSATALWPGGGCGGRRGRLPARFVGGGEGRPRAGDAFLLGGCGGGGGGGGYLPAVLGVPASPGFRLCCRLEPAGGAERIALLAFTAPKLIYFLPPEILDGLLECSRLSLY